MDRPKDQIQGLDEFQEICNDLVGPRYQVDHLPSNQDRGYELLYNVLALCEEAGEVAGKIKKKIRNHCIHSYYDHFSEEDILSINKELGDCLFFLCRSAHMLRLPMSQVALINHLKLIDRKNRGVLKGEGDNR